MKKFSVKTIIDTALPVGEAAVGYGAARLVEKLVNEKDEQRKNTIVGVAQLGLGIFLVTQKNKHISSVGFGVALAGANAFLADPIQRAIDSLGIEKKVAGIGSRYFHRNYNNASNAMMSGINCNQVVS